MKEKRKRIVKVVDRKNRSTIIGNAPYDGSQPKFKEDFKKWLVHPLYELLRERPNSINPIKINEDMRTSPPKKTSVRLELEEYVYAWNTVLKDAVKTMDIVILLRNAHPAYRSAFASRLFEIGLITDQQRSEFIILPPLRIHSRTNWRL